jgi:ribosomal protein RSM22 (predicted rRNA methylase)
MTDAIPFQFTPAFDQLLQTALLDRGVDLQEPHRLADSIVNLSDFYLHNPGCPTPWERPFTVNAYLGYFLPLNYIRVLACLRELQRFLPETSYSEVWDFGSGLGTTQWALESEPGLIPKPLKAIESSPLAWQLHQQLLTLTPTRWPVSINDKSKPNLQALAIFSYAFLEMQPDWNFLEPFDHLLIIEPSTRECGRALMEWRDQLLTRGFAALAPCTHAFACPLLTHSHKDWCHQRIHFNGPEWWERLESKLPMRNRTLTYSYLLMSRTQQDTTWRSAARVIGDTLKENGKTRQLICRGPAREFLSWLHKKGDVPRIARGALVRGLESAEPAGGNELRPPPGSLHWTP